MEKGWKLYQGKTNTYYQQNLNPQNIPPHRWGYEFLFGEIFDWEYSGSRCIYEMWDCAISEDDIVVDLGANVGFFTHYAATKTSQVIAIEGGHEVFSCLVENTCELGNVKYLNASVLGKNMNTPFLWSPKGNPHYLGIEDVFRIFGLERINFLKCDIEGGEYDLLMNMDPEILSRIDKIAVETHDPIQNESFYLPGKTRHTFYWDINQDGQCQVMCYFVPSY